MLVIAALSNYSSVKLPIDCKSIECGIGTAIFTLDVIFAVVGVFLILIAFIFHRLNLGK
jgi:hypothetical protein